MKQPETLAQHESSKVTSTHFVICLFRLFTGTYPNIEQRLIWEAKNIEVPSWRKVVVELPNDVNEYRLLFEGEYNKTTNYHTRNFVTIDNIELRSCSHKGKLVPSPYHSSNTLSNTRIYLPIRSLFIAICYYKPL